VPGSIWPPGSTLDVCLAVGGLDPSVSSFRGKRARQFLPLFFVLVVGDGLATFRAGPSLCPAFFTPAQPMKNMKHWRLPALDPGASPLISG